MDTTVVLLTRDLRVRDNPALAGALERSDRVLPLFVLDPVLLAISPNRARFLAQSLEDLRSSLRERGGDLVVRRGDPVTQVLRMARTVRADGIAIAADVSRYALRRERRLRAGCDERGLALTVHSGPTVVAPGALRPGSGAPAYHVFTPYHRVWRSYAWREPVATPRRVDLPAGVDPGTIRVAPSRDLSPHAAPGGETAGRARLLAWRDDLPDYDTNHDLVAVDRTSRLSPYLRFGCLSAVELARTAATVGGPAAEAFIRQLCWRDFYHQLTAAHPDLTTTPVRRVDEAWHTDPGALAAWHWGRTGVPIVDAGMRQLLAEGWMHNRARLLTASYLTKHLGLDWREGAAWFSRWLLDGDVPNNYGNWQWTAGVGTDTRPYRRFNPIRQAYRYDPDGAYVRRFVPELAELEGPAVHEPWRGVDRPADGYAEALW